MDVAPNASVDQLRAPFEAHRPPTIGLEEELMLLHPETLELRPCAAELLERLDGDGRFRPELPAAQLEIVGAPAATVAGAVASLRDGRLGLVRVAYGLARPAGAGVHPFSPAEGALRGGDERYDAMAREYASVARRQLVFGLHVHVAVTGADCALAVHNALREQLPALAALGAASPYYEGRDTGLASMRPKLSELLPRQGVPPAIPSWQQLAEDLAWGRRSGAMTDAGQWWWELRLHPVHGTVEVRVPDAQATLADVAALAAVVHALVVTLAERHRAGEAMTPAPTWRIEENRWSACRHGVDGRWADVRTGRTRPMAEHLYGLLDELAPAAAALRCAAELATARQLIERPRADAVRAVAADGGPHALARWLAERFLAV